MARQPRTADTWRRTRTSGRESLRSSPGISSPTFFLFSSRRRHTIYWRDWSSDVCSSDLVDLVVAVAELERALADRAELAGHRAADDGSALRAVLAGGQRGPLVLQRHVPCSAADYRRGQVVRLAGGDLVDQVVAAARAAGEAALALRGDLERPHEPQLDLARLGGSCRGRQRHERQGQDPYGARHRVRRATIFSSS